MIVLAEDQKMDAAKLSFSRTAFLFTAALLIPASAFAQAPTLMPSLTAVTLQGLTPQADIVSSSGGSAAPITFSACTAYQAGDLPWLTISHGATDNVSKATTPYELDLEVGQQAGQLSYGTHSAEVVLWSSSETCSQAVADTTNPAIIVSFTTNSNSGGGAGAITASPTAVSQGSLSYPATIYTSVNLVTSSTTPIAFSLTPSTSWITAALGSDFNGQVVAGSPAQINLTLNGSGYQQTTLSGFLTVNYSGTSLSIPVTFGNGVTVGSSSGGGTTQGSLTLSQNPVSLTYVNGSYNFPFTSVTLNGTSGLTYQASASSTNNWLLVNGNTYIYGTLPNNQLTISVNSQAQNLTPGTVYTGVVNITAADGSSLQLTVNLTVNGTNTTGLTINPNPIAISSPLNGQPQSQAVVITSTTGGNVSVSVSGQGLTVSTPSSTSVGAGGSTGVTVTANPSGLSAGTYIGTLNVTVGSSTQTAQVTFTVGSGSGSGTGTTSNIAAAPSALTFFYEANGSLSPAQSQQVLLVGSGNYTANPSTITGGNWLSVSSTQGVLPTQFFGINVSAAGLVAGQYSGSVTFTNTTNNSSSVVSVTLYVTNTSAVYASPGDLIFNYIGGSSSAAQFQDLSLLTSDNSVVQVSAAVSNPSNTPWLTVSGTGTTSGSIFYVTANASNLANGIYTGYITVTSTTGNSPVTVPVVLNVTGSSVSGSGGTGTLTLGTSSITLQPAAGATATQQLTVSATSATSFTASSSTSNCGSTWLSISPSGGSLSTNSTITVTGNAAGITNGTTCNGTIALTSGGGTQTVPVTMIVGGTGSTGGTLSLTANGAAVTSLTFNAPSLGATVSSQTVSIASASGFSAVSFTAALSGSNCSWVTLSTSANQSYSTPYNLVVGASTTSLAAGTYSCTLTLTTTSGTSVAVPLSLTVVGVPTISIATTTVSFSYAAGTAAPATQTVTITGAGSAAAAFTATATSTGNWLSVSPASGTASAGSPAMLTVSVNPNGLAVGTYTGTIAIAAGTGATGSGSIAVTLTVTAPTPSITSVVNGASFLGGAVSPGEFVSIFGSSLGPITPLGPSIGSNGNVTTTQGQVQVFFGGTAAALTYVSSTQINCTVPYEVAGLSTIAVQVKYLAQPSNTVNLTVGNSTNGGASAPGIFTETGTGMGQGAILNQNSTINTSGNPAAKGSIIQIFMTGEGVTSPAGTDGGVTNNATTVPVLPIAVKIGGQPATVIFEGEAPGIVAGVLQLNVMIPPTVSSGANSIIVTIGSNSSQTGVTVSVQ